MYRPLSHSIHLPPPPPPHHTRGLVSLSSPRTRSRWRPRRNNTTPCDLQQESSLQSHQLPPRHRRPQPRQPPVLLLPDRRSCRGQPSSLLRHVR